MNDNDSLKNQSLISGTTRLEDLVPHFLKFLAGIKGKSIPELMEEIGLSLASQAAIYCWLMGVDDIEVPDDVQGEISSFLSEELFQKLSEVSPDGFYFGSHPGDGSDYGWWEVDNDV